MVRRLWIVTNSLSAGGGQIFAYREAKYFADQGYKVVFIALFGILDNVGKSMYRELRQVDIDVIIGGRSKRGLLSLVLKVLSLKTPQIAHSHLDHSDIFIKFIRSVRMVNFIIVRTLHTEKFSPNLRLLHWYMLKGFINVSCSNSIEIPQLMIHAVIPNGVPRYLSRHRVFYDCLNVVVVGNFNSVHGRYVKNQEFIIKELAKCKFPYEVTFVGDGENRTYCESLANQLNVTSRFVGNVYDVVDLLMYAHILLSASIFEGTPLSILEAKSTGLPLFLSNIEAHKQFKCSEFFELTNNSLKNGLEKYFEKNKGKNLISNTKDLRYEDEVYSEYHEIFQEI